VKTNAGRLLSALFILCLTIVSQAEIITEYGTLRGFLIGEEPGCAYDNFVTHISEGVVEPDYNDYNPHDPQTTGFGHYEVIYDNNEGNTLLAHWRDLFSYMMLHEWENAEQLLQEELSEYPYQIVHLIDTLTSVDWYLVREQLDLSYFDENHPLIPEDDENGSFDYSWGLYVFASEAEHPRVLVELVHPNDDYITLYTGYDMFVTLDAGAMFISSAGREVVWTEEGDYSNGKSISDPSRNEFHVLQQAHIAFVNYWVYEQSGEQQPLPIQVHSYDTEGRDLYSVIITPSRYDRQYNLPLYDWSGQLGGLIDRTPCAVHPPGFIGNVDTVWISDYYGANALPRLEVCDGVVLNNSPDLLGFGGNRQLNYLDGLRDYCTDEEWVLHVEMDELPDCIGDSTEYGFYAEPGYPLTWQNFVGATSYYHPVSRHLRESLDTLAQYEDIYPPIPPQNLHVVQSHGDRIDLGWERASDPWFGTYRLYYSTTPGVDVTCPSISREEYSQFCSPRTEEYTLTDLEYGSTWYFRLAAFDRDLRMSAMTEELEVTTVDSDPPQLVVDLPPASNSTWWNGNSGTIRVWITDDFSLIDGAAIEYRRDYNQDGDYDGIMENWNSAPVVADGNPITVEVEFDYQDPPEGACFEIRARDLVSQHWGYSGKDDEQGIDDDYKLFQDDLAPEPPHAFYVDSLNLTGWFNINWLGIDHDSTFASYLLLYSQEESDSSAQCLDRLNIEELGDIRTNSARVTQITDPGEWWFRMAAEDWAGNRSALTDPVSIQHPGISGVAITDFSINYSEGNVSLSWGVDISEEFSGTIVGYEIHRSEESLFQPSLETLLTTVTQQQFFEPLPGQLAFYRVIALVTD
jgi:hypothetical protein